MPHPVVVLDRAVGTAVQVWEWWSGGSAALPCLLWCAEPGWSAAVVEPDTFDTEGYGREFWSHRIKLLDLAIANALGSYRTLEELEVNVAATASFGLGPRAVEVKRAIQWGILQLRTARAGMKAHAYRGGPTQGVRTAGGGLVDHELAQHALIPSLPKPRVAISHEAHEAHHASARAIVRTLPNLGLTENVAANHRIGDQANAKPPS